MNHTRFSLTALSALTLLSYTAEATPTPGITKFIANIDGQQVVQPPIVPDSIGTGVGEFLLDETSVVPTFSWNYSLTDFFPMQAEMKVAPPLQEGRPEVLGGANLLDDDASALLGAADQAKLAELLNGNWYIEFSIIGEQTERIRGQLIPWIEELPPTEVPEPTTYALLGSALALAMRARRTQANKNLG